MRTSTEGDHIVSNVHRPSLTLFLPAKEKATGAAVVIIPGGGHVELWMDHEGCRIGQWMSDHGIAGFVLKYRLSRAEGSAYTIDGHSLPDVQRARRRVRSRAHVWGVAPERIGVIGFSAGGQLAALASTRYDSGNKSAADPIERESSRPAFQALIYPGLPLDLKISKDNPPAFLLCGGEDRAEIAEGLPNLYLSLRRAGVQAELHILAGVGHGFGLRDTNRGPIASWLDLFKVWLNAGGFLKTR